MPTAHGRRRHPSKVYSRSTHSGYREDVGTGALDSKEREGLPWSKARDGEQMQLPDIGPDAVDGAVHIRPRSLRRPLFAETLTPPEVLGTLPTLPDDDYPQGVLVFLTSDEKLYRNTDGSTWSVAVDGADIIANSITAGQIEAGAIGTTELAADAVIANVANVGGTVTIDSDGITILDGALTLTDYADESVLGPAGFAGGWIDFMETGFYNGNLNGGELISLISSTSIVNTANTPADYAASLSPIVPYWVISGVTGSATYGLEIFDSSVTLGKSLVIRKTGAAASTVTFFQDVPVRTGVPYEFKVTFAVEPTEATDNSVTVYRQELDANHGAISGETETLTYTMTFPTSLDYLRGPALFAVAPTHEEVRFYRLKFVVRLGATVSSHAAAMAFSKFDVDARPYTSGLYFPYIGTSDLTTTFYDYLFRTATGLDFYLGEAGRYLTISNIDGSGLGTDTALRILWSAANTFWVTNEGEVNADRLRLASTTDAAPGSSGHGLQVGPTGGENLIIDQNEIMARNNGATSDLRLNNDGGATIMGGSADVHGALTVDNTIVAGSTGGGAITLANNNFIEMIERGSDPGAPGANNGRIYLRDNGAGKTQLVVRFSSGAIQVIATQP